MSPAHFGLNVGAVLEEDLGDIRVEGDFSGKVIDGGLVRFCLFRLCAREAADSNRASLVLSKSGVGRRSKARNTDTSGPRLPKKEAGRREEACVRACMLRLESSYQKRPALQCTLKHERAQRPENSSQSLWQREDEPSMAQQAGSWPVRTFR